MDTIEISGYVATKIKAYGYHVTRKDGKYYVSSEDYESYIEDETEDYLNSL